MCLSTARCLTRPGAPVTCAAQGPFTSKVELETPLFKTPSSASSTNPAAAGDRILPHALILSRAQKERVQQYYAVVDGLSSTCSLFWRQLARSWQSVVRWSPECSLLTLLPPHDRRWQPGGRRVGYPKRSITRLPHEIKPIRTYIVSIQDVALSSSRSNQVIGSVYFAQKRGGRCNQEAARGRMHQ